MILAPRKHLLATNIVFFFVIFIVQKFIRIFCIIEAKACKNANCSKENRCEERCTTPPKPPTPPSPAKPPVKRRRFVSLPTALRKTMHNFGYGEGHYQIFVEEKQRQRPSKARLNAVVADGNAAQHRSN